MTPDWAEDLDNKKYERQGFIITNVGTDNDGKELFEAQRIDDPKNWVEEGEEVPPLLENDDAAVELAKKEGFLFADIDNPYKVTGKQ